MTRIQKQTVTQYSCTSTSFILSLWWQSGNTFWISLWLLSKIKHLKTCCIDGLSRFSSLSVSLKQVLKFFVTGFIFLKTSIFIYEMKWGKWIFILLWFICICLDRFGVVIVLFLFVRTPISLSFPVERPAQKKTGISVLVYTLLWFAFLMCRMAQNIKILVFSSFHMHLINVT